MRKFTLSFKILAIFSILSICLVTTSLGTTATTSNTAPEEFTLQSIAQIAVNVSDSTWDTDTEISEIFTTYDMDLSVNGYIFNLTTDGNQTGFMQILVNDTEYDIIAYSFKGTSSLNSMIAACESTKHFNKNSKFIYIGNMDYFVKEDSGNSGKYYSLYYQTPFTVDKDQMKADYKEMKTNMKNENKNKNKLIPGSLTASAAGVTKYVTGADNKYLVPPEYIKDCITNGSKINGQTPTGHCGPLAGTSIISYWSTNLWNDFYWWIFSSLYVNMQTNVGIQGTTDVNVVAGLERYSVSTRGVPISGKYLTEVQANMDFTHAQSWINQNIPFIILTQNYNNPYTGSISGNHFITCFGYSTASGCDQLIVNDNYTTINWTFQSIGSITKLAYCVDWW